MPCPEYQQINDYCNHVNDNEYFTYDNTDNTDNNDNDDNTDNYNDSTIISYNYDSDYKSMLEN